MPPICLTRTRRMLLSGRKLGLDCRYPTFTETVGTLFICLGSQGSLAVGWETARTSGTGWAHESTWGSIGGSGKDLAGDTANSICPGPSRKDSQDHKLLRVRGVCRDLERAFTAIVGNAETNGDPAREVYWHLGTVSTPGT